nr:MAG TPA: TFIIF, beta subunit HTH domain [Caudoviricetes sp.]DAO83008.1 MAG TPA: TFIIF, beta subunit HTH domain [Caudoviricetes sp.]
MRYFTLKRLVEFYGKPNMTVGEFLEIIKGLNNGKF